MAKPSKSKYRTIHTCMYSDSNYLQLSGPEPNAKSLWQYLLTGPQTSSIPGLYCSGEAGLSEALDWTVEGFRKAWQEIESKHMAKADWKARVVWIPNSISYNEPANPNIVLGWEYQLHEIPDCPLKREALLEISNHLKLMGENFFNSFITIYPQASNSNSNSTHQEPLPKPLQEQLPEQAGNGMANIEQEQEHKREANKVASLPRSEAVNGKSQRNGFHGFNKSDFYDLIALKEKLSDWPELKVEYYYEQMLSYWKSVGKQYKDWSATAQSWHLKDVREGRGEAWKNYKGIEHE